MSWSAARALGQAEESIPAVHDTLAMLGRQRRVAMAAGAIVLLCAVVYGLFLTGRYEARMELLVDQSQLRRADPVASGNPDAQPIVNQQGSASDEALNSEIALLRSDSVLSQVVAVCGLDRNPGFYYSAIDGLWNVAGHLHLDGVLGKIALALPFLRRPTQQELTAKAVSRLASKLSVEIIKLSDVISVSYRSSNPRQAAQVLQVLGNVYLKEHARAHHPQDELAFFARQTAQAHAALVKAEQNLVSFTQAGGVANGETQLQNALLRLSNTKAAQDQVQAEIAGALQRIGELQKQANSIPPRQTTVLKSSDSALLIQQLKSSLLTLQMKRTQLLTEYQPTYPLVVEVNEQIRQAQAALADAEKSRVDERTTDRDPAFEMVREDLARARVELAGAQARATSLAQEYASDSQQVRWLEQQGMEQQDLMRQQKAAQDDYLLLLHKQQEAQVSAALDKRGIFNVSIVQPASVPALPVHPAWWYLLYGGVLAMFAAFAAAAGADRLDPTLRTAEEAEGILHAPVLAILALAAPVPDVIEPMEKALPGRSKQQWKLT